MRREREKSVCERRANAFFSNDEHFLRLFESERAAKQERAKVLSSFLGSSCGSFHKLERSFRRRLRENSQTSGGGEKRFHVL